MVSPMIDSAAVVACALGELLPGVDTYFHGPEPNYVRQMVVYDVLEPVPLDERFPWEAVEFNAVFNCFHRDREAAFEMARTACYGVYDMYLTHESLVVEGRGVRLSHVELVQLPTAENDNLVNDSQIYRFDFELKIIARHV